MSRATELAQPAPLHTCTKTWYVRAISSPPSVCCRALSIGPGAAIAAPSRRMTNGNSTPLDDVGGSHAMSKLDGVTLEMDVI
jgi:hypothetical protein